MDKTSTGTQVDSKGKRGNTGASSIEIEQEAKNAGTRNRKMSRRESS